MLLPVRLLVPSAGRWCRATFNTNCSTLFLCNGSSNNSSNSSSISCNGNIISNNSSGSSNNNNISSSSSKNISDGSRSNNSSGSTVSQLPVGNTAAAATAGAAAAAEDPAFGLLVDIDGVLVRGSVPIPAAVSALRHLQRPLTAEWRVPLVFLTNSTSTLPDTRARQLSRLLGVHIAADQLVMAYSPLEQLQLLAGTYNSGGGGGGGGTVLVVGQGDVLGVCRHLRLTSVVTVDQLCRHCPHLDVVDLERRAAAAAASAPAAAAADCQLPQIAAVLLLGEPVRWETSLQLVLDVLLTGGQPAAARCTTTTTTNNNNSTHHRQHSAHSSSPPAHQPAVTAAAAATSHVPVFACNPDLQWQSAAREPRLAHGAFLACLETLYAKLAGAPLHYTALTGKPCLTTYRYAVQQLCRLHRRQPRPAPLHTVYGVGDNVSADIVGANMYSQWLMTQRGQWRPDRQPAAAAAGVDTSGSAVRQCVSVLVRTGVDGHSDSDSDSGKCSASLLHVPRDLQPIDKSLAVPDVVSSDLLEAVLEIFKRHNFR